MNIEELKEFRDRMYRDPELLAYYEQGDENSSWQTRHDATHGDEVTALAVELTKQIDSIFPGRLDEVTREFVIPCAAWLHDIGRSVDIDTHDIEGARITVQYLKKHKIPKDLIGRIGRIVANHRAGAVINRGIKSDEQAIVVIADKCIGDEERVRGNKARALRILRLFGIGKRTLARVNWWYNAPHDRVNFAIKEAGLFIEMDNPDPDDPKGEIVLKLRIDEAIAPKEEIVTLDWFADSFHACGKAAKRFGCYFRIEFNGTRYMWSDDACDGDGGWIPVQGIVVHRGDCDS